MTQRVPPTPVPAPLEAYAQQFDDLWAKHNQRDRFRRYVAGVLLPSERNKTLTALANTEPVVGAQLPRAQQLQWFVSEANWDLAALTGRRIELLQADPVTAPTGDGVLLIDETGDRKDGTKTAHVGRQYLANLGKIDNGVVSVSTVWAAAQVYYPLEVEPYTPAHHFRRGKTDAAFRTKPAIAWELVQQAVAATWWPSSPHTPGGIQSGPSAPEGRPPRLRGGTTGSSPASGSPSSAPSETATGSRGGRWRST